ncbi:hypothetical protein E2C01_069119 [Portunus trituberculatus]|uniref:Uncharacterized protein n=1 Tax=Portunus trituberculatus TaxID=210409 RepID=A0A5B7I1Y5_PORTR|nr:hypothetical protein [Portunus trituberculatus]
MPPANNDKPPPLQPPPPLPPTPPTPPTPPLLPPSHPTSAARDKVQERDRMGREREVSSCTCRFNVPHFNQWRSESRREVVSGMRAMRCHARDTPQHSQMPLSLSLKYTYYTLTVSVEGEGS